MIYRNLICAMHPPRNSMAAITANDLKTRGVAAIEAVLSDHDEAIVSVRGNDRFVVMDMAHYYHLRECELCPVDATRLNICRAHAVGHIKHHHDINAG